MASLAAGTSLAQAQDASWLGGTADSSFNYAPNWSTGSVPTDTASFGASPTTSIGLGTGAVSVGTLQFDAGAPAYAFSGTSDVTLSGQGIVNNSSNAPSIDLSGATLAFTNTASAGNATLSIAAGTISFADTSSGSTARIVLNSGGNLSIADLSSVGTTVGSVEGAGNIVLGSKRLTTGGNGASTTLSGIVSGAGGSLVKTGAGTMTLTGNNTYTGTTTISGGTLQIGNGGTSGTLGTGNVVNNGTLAVNRSDTLAIGNVISGSGSLTQIGSGTTILAGNNTYTGTTTISGGTLQIGNGGTSGSLGTGSVVNNGTLALNRSNTLSINNAISGSGSLMQIGSGTTILSGNNTYTGTTTISGGTLRVGNGVSSGSLGTGAVVNNGILNFNRSDVFTVANNISGSGALVLQDVSVLVLTGTNSYTGTTTINGGTVRVGNGGTSGSLGTGNVVMANTGTLAFNRADTVTVSNAISGSGNLSQLGSGTIIVTGNNSYDGITTVSNGTLQVGNGGTAGSLGLRNVVDNGTLAFNRTDTVTVGNAISGSGAVGQIGNGTTILTGANTYSGSTTISNGTLQIGNGGTSGSLGSGAVTDNGILAFNRADTVTVANAISGSGAVKQIGSGTTILTGSNTYTGGTSITAGQLSLNGSVASGVSVGSGGTLGGSGTINGALVNAGILAPGNSIGTLTVNGSYTQSAGGTYQAEVNAAGQSDRVVVNGTATLNGGTVAVQAASGNYGATTTYALLSATGGVTGTYAGVTSNYAFLAPSLSYDAKNAYLTLTRSFSGGATTSNQAAVGTVLDQSAATASGDYGAAVSAMSSLNTLQGPAALSSLSGLAYAGFASAAMQTSQLFLNQLGDQLVASHKDDRRRRRALAEACANTACDYDEPGPWGVWGNGLGGTGYVAGDGNAPGITYTAAGFTAGIDYRVAPDLVIGVAAGYTNGTQYAQGVVGKGTSDSVLASLYASYVPGPFYVNAMLGYAYSGYQMWRTIAIPGLSSRTAYGLTGANQFLGQAEAGYGFVVDRATEAVLTPFVRLQAATSTQNAFSETGADSLDLNVAAQTTNSLRGVIGADLSARLDLGWRDRLAMTLRLGFAHEFADTSRPVTASFAGAPGLNFTVYGAQPSRNSAVLGLGATTVVGDNTAVFLRYDGLVGGSNSAQAITAGFRLSW